MRSSIVAFTENIEEEKVDIIEKSLVIQEELSQVAQILAEQLFLLAVNLKHWDIGIAVDLISWRMLNATPL